VDRNIGALRGILADHRQRQQPAGDAPGHESGALVATDFGAVGDGKVDDGPALQRAIDAAQGANKVVIGVAAMTSFLCSLVHFVMHRNTKQISTQPVRHRVYSSLGVNVPWAVESLRRRLVYFERRVAIETY
jgi:hypothetical protein